MKKQKAGLNVMRALKLSEDDLDANEHGKLGKSQRRYLVKQRIGYGLIFVVFLLLFLAASYITFISRNLTPDFILPLLMAGLLGVGVYQIGKKAYDLHRDIQAGEIASIEGRIELILNDAYTYYGRVSQYHIRVGRLKFPIDKAVLTSFKNDEPYQIYYAPHAKILLGAEWLREDNPFQPDEEDILYDEEDSAFYNQISPTN